MLLRGILLGGPATTGMAGAALAELPDQAGRTIWLIEDASPSNPATISTRRHPKLERTLDQLAMETDPRQAALVEQIVWRLWLDSGNGEIDRLMQRASVLMALGENELALAVLDEVVRRAPDYAEGWNKRATVLYLLGRLQHSVIDCQKVLTLEPRHFGALAGLGLISLALGRKTAALEAYRLAIKIHPLMPGAVEMVERLRQETEGDPT